MKEDDIEEDDEDDEDTKDEGENKTIAPSSTKHFRVVTQNDDIDRRHINIVKGRKDYTNDLDEAWRFLVNKVTRSKKARRLCNEEFDEFASDIYNTLTLA